MGSRASLVRMSRNRKKRSKSKNHFKKNLMKKRKNQKRYSMVCIKNEGYEAALEKRKIYQAIDDEKAANLRLIRIVDESGQSYLFPQEFFTPIRLSRPLMKALDFAA